MKTKQTAIKHILSQCLYPKWSPKTCMDSNNGCQRCGFRVMKKHWCTFVSGVTRDLKRCYLIAFHTITLKILVISPEPIFVELIKVFFSKTYQIAFSFIALVPLKHTIVNNLFIAQNHCVSNYYSVLRPKQVLGRHFGFGCRKTI